METLLFDLEWVIYNNQNENFCEWFIDIYGLAKQKNIQITIATWADINELEIINSKIKIYDFFKNIFSSIELWFGLKSNPLFFQYIVKTLKTDPDKTRLIDDWGNGIKWAKTVWINTFFVWQNPIQCSDKFWTLQNFFTFLQTI